MCACVSPESGSEPGRGAAPIAEVGAAIAANGKRWEGTGVVAKATRGGKKKEKQSTITQKTRRKKEN